MTQPVLSGAQYNATFGDIRRGGVSDHQRNRTVLEERTRLSSVPFETASVFNLHSFPLTVYLGELGVIVVPAAQGDALGKLHLNDFRFSMRDMGDGIFHPTPVMPFELAREVMREYGATGGVIQVKGDQDPTPEQIVQAKGELRAWWQSEYQKAVDAWQRYRQHKLITDRQREAARMLFHLNAIAALPEWVTVTRDEGTHKDCPQCGESVKKAAKLCRYCHSDFKES